jgi:hypothetical protein
MLSVPPMLRLWHELHDMKPDLERRGSKKSILPSSTIFSFFGWAAGMGCMGSSANAAVGMATAPTDSSDTINARIIIVYLPKTRL